MMCIIRVMQTLPDYLSKHGLTQRAFAVRVGVDQSIVSRLCAGRMTPSLDLALRIERETGGAVAPGVWRAMAVERKGAA
jgi:transcriptional regulator with XRE-family HTH domain